MTEPAIASISMTASAASPAGVDIMTDSHDTNGVLVLDADGDGDLDVVAGNIVPSISLGSSNVSAALYVNDGAGAFSSGGSISTDGAATTSLVAGDVNSDGLIDVISLNQAKNRLYINAARVAPFGASANITSDASGSGRPAFGDVDGDGDLDLIVPTYGGRNRLYRNDGSGNYGGWKRHRHRLVGFLVCCPRRRGRRR